MSSKTLIAILLSLLCLVCLPLFSYSAQVSGTIYHDGSTLFTNGNMRVRFVYADVDNLGAMNEQEWGSTVVSNSTAKFVAENVPAGSFFLQISLDNKEDNYVEEWWASTPGVKLYTRLPKLLSRCLRLSM